MTKIEAIEHFGSVDALAKALGIRVQAVYQWTSIPMLRQFQLERQTNGRLRADEPRSSQVDSAA